MPHFLGRLRVWTLKAGKLVEIASISDTSNHVAGTRELGLAALADCDGNRVVGVFRNDFAHRMLAASIPAGIEAPIRSGSDLRKVAADLNVIFATIASEAAKP